MTGIDWDQIKQQLDNTVQELQRKDSRAPEYWAELLQQRTDQLAKRTPEQHRETQAFFSFQLGTESYLLKLDVLQEIRPFAQCCPLPLSPPELLGVSYHRGQMVSILDLSQVLKLAPTTPYYILYLRCKPPLGFAITAPGEVRQLTQEEQQENVYFQTSSSEISPQTERLLNLQALFQHPIIPPHCHFIKES